MRKFYCHKCRKRYSDHDGYWSNNYKMLTFCSACYQNLIARDAALAEGWFFYQEPTEKQLSDCECCPCYCACHD